MYENVKIKTSLLDSDKITFNPPIGAAYILELDGLTQYNMSQDYSEVVFGYWGRSEDLETGLINLCIYPPIGNYYENDPDSVGYYRGRVTYNGEEYDSWYWDNTNNTIIYTDIITEYEFFNFRQYCPTIDALNRSLWMNKNFKVAINNIMGNSSSTALSYTLSKSDATSVTVNGSSYMICRTGGSSADAIHTSTNNAYLYNPSTSIKYSITPFYTLNGTMYVNPNVVLTSVAYTSIAGTHHTQIYLPVFSYSTDNQPVISKMLGPYNYDSYKESINIIWDRKDNIISPKYILYYFYAVGNGPSVGADGTTVYDSTLTKIIEI